AAPRTGRTCQRGRRRSMDGLVAQSAQALASAAADRFFGGDDPIEACVVRARWHHPHFLLCVREPCGDRAVGAVERDDAVVVAAALAEATAGAVEGDKRDEEEAR